MSTAVTLRLPDETASRLRAWARRTGRSVSEVGARWIEEWLRQGEFADIEFRGFGDERHACLKGTMPVWQVVMVAQEYGSDLEQTAAHFQWPLHRVRAAMNYYEAYPEEIDGAILDNRAMSYDRLKRILPSVERFTVDLSSTDTPASR